MEQLVYTWTTAETIRETHDTVTIQFNTGGVAFYYTPGQFVQVSLFIGDQRFTRSYSLSSVPGDKYPAITVKRVNNGVMSNYIIDHGDQVREWQIEGPFGYFTTDHVIPSTSCAILIGGGSGISPLFAQIRHLLSNTALKILLINCNRTPDDVIFSDALAYMEQSFSARFKAWHIFSGDINNRPLPYRNVLHGRLSRLVLKKILRQEYGAALNAASIFLCGPSGLLQLAQETLSALSVPEHNIHKEFFSPAPSSANTIIPVTEMQEVLLHYYDQANLLEVIPGKSILDAALEDRIPLPYSCKSGTCGRCTAKLLSGQVHMNNNYALPPAMISDGYVYSARPTLWTIMLPLSCKKLFRQHASKAVSKQHDKNIDSNQSILQRHTLQVLGMRGQHGVMLIHTLLTGIDYKWIGCIVVDI